MVPLDWMDVRATGQPSAGDGPDPEGIALPELLADLNEPQVRAVTHGEGPLLILAGAGSGKTRVITRRIAWLVATGRAAPQDILAITFTNKAAGEMRARVERFLPVQGLWISTFHAACARILRREIEVLGGWTRDFSIYDTYDRNALVKEIVKDLGFDVQRFRPAMLAAWIGEAKNRRYEREPRGPALGGIEGQVFEQVRARYEEAMRERNALDFDDLLVRVLEIFEGHPGLRDAYAARFRYVLVDEYQDTNRVQYLLVRHLADWHGNLTVCGDPDQSIYAWRGADIGNILDFERDFGGERPVGVVKLERNYRSTECILKVAQSVIRHNRGRKEKDLWTEKRSDVRVRALECADEDDEAREIALQIRGLAERGFHPDRIAIFYRVNFMQRALERALRLAGIPYQIVGGVEFYERREIRDLIGYLRLLVNPRDDTACARVINVPGRGIGAKSLEELSRLAGERGLALLAAASSAEARALLKGRSRAGLESFATLIQRLSGYAERPAAEALEAVLAGTDYLRWLCEGGEAEALSREENVEELLANARTYDAEHPEGGLRGYLQDVALVSDVDAWGEQAPRATLMTLHSSKGLEFPVVFIAGLEEGLLPHALAIADARSEEAGIEEERRLLYVGMTRAMDELFLTRANVRLHYGESSWRSPSRFLAEIPPELLEGLEPEEEDDPVDSTGARASAPEFRAGDRVEHEHFGHGVVERVAGSGINARVTVDFHSAGTRVLLVQYARLRMVGR